jgi:glycosyltransferase involved in cell wall biosynthesis
VTDSLPVPKLSTVITCYRDEQAIGPMHERLSRVLVSLGVDYEIIFVNDGSPDDAAAILEALTVRDAHVLVIEHSRNFGSQSAFVSGMQLATGDAVVLLDGDLQDPPELIADFFAKWREGYDVVYGRRARREGSLVFAVLVKVFYRIFRGVSDVPMPLDAGDFALMDRKVVDALLALPETDQFLRGLRAWVGFRQTGVAYVRPNRAFGRSTHSFLKNVWWARKGIFSFTFLPIELLGYAGVTMTAVASCALVHQSVDAWLRPEVPHGISVIIVLVAFFGSLHLLALAILGEYVIKVLEEAKRRPQFIRKAIRHGGAVFTTPAEIDGFLRSRRRDQASLRPTGGAPLKVGDAGDGS